MMKPKQSGDDSGGSVAEKRKEQAAQDSLRKEWQVRAGKTIFPICLLLSDLQLAGQSGNATYRTEQLQYLLLLGHKSVGVRVINCFQDTQV